MEDEDDFLAAVEADNAVEAVTDPAPEPEARTPMEPEAAEQPALAEPVNPLTPPVVDVKPDPGFVPITVVLDEREKRQKAERELEQFRSQQPAPQPQQIPDMLDDPEGYAAFHANTVHTAALNVKLDMSEEFVRQQKGDEIVDKARDWALEQFQRRPGFQHEALSQRNPYGFIVQQYERDQIASSVSADDFAQFQAWRQAQAQLTQQQQPAAPAAAPSPSAPPRSLASAPSAGGVSTEVMQTDAEVFDEIFTRK